MIRHHEKTYSSSLSLWRQTRAAIDGKPSVLELILKDSDCGIVSPRYKGNAKDVSAMVCDFWNRPSYWNATGMTKESYDGMIKSKEPVAVWSSEMDYLEYRANGSDGIRAVSSEVVSEILETGRYGLLADMPQMKTSRLSDAIEPVMRGYKAENIFYWRTVGNKLVEVRMYEEFEKDSGSMNHETELQIRRLVLLDEEMIIDGESVIDEKGAPFMRSVYHNQVWRGVGSCDSNLFELTNDNPVGGEMISDVPPIANGAYLDFIPFQFIGADNNTPGIGKIPLFDLGSANLEHFRLAAYNQENLEYHAQGCTNLFIGDIEEFNTNNPIGMQSGAKGFNILGKEDRVEIIQIEATGALPAEMDRAEKRIIGLGAQVVQDINTNKTLGGQEMEFAASTSTLKRISYNCTDGINQVLEWMQLFKGLTTDISYKLNTQFVTDNMDAPMVAQHLSMVMNGFLPGETLMETARKAGLTEEDNETLLQMIEDQVPVSGTDEETAILQAEIDDLREQLEAAKGKNKPVATGE